MNIFEKYPYVQITTDPFEPSYNFKYTQCVKEVGVVRFERMEKKLPKGIVEKFLAEVLENG